MEKIGNSDFRVLDLISKQKYLYDNHPFILDKMLAQIVAKRKSLLYITLLVIMFEYTCTSFLDWNYKFAEINSAQNHPTIYNHILYINTSVITWK